MTEVLAATDKAIAKAAGILRRGGLVAFPTETVYGLGADAENPAAVQAMFAAKGRPADHPVIVHLANAAQLEQVVANVPQTARQLAAAFWPGPMTLVLPRSSRISDLVTGGLGTIGVRVPAHPVAQALLQAFGGPVAAPSANRFGRVSATRASHVFDELNGVVELILDGGACDIGLESTIVDLTGPQPRLLRPGGITRDQIEATLNSAVGGATADAPRVSGSLPSHYAPHARVEIVTRSSAHERAVALSRDGKRVALLASERPPADLPVVYLPLPESAQRLAHDLYDLLRQVDHLHCDVALVTLPDQQGLGEAITDRLRRAAGPRE